ncbi:tetratricopeptide repeat protein 39B-like [Sycon ciliatum]|uniref:tetratricopeptide repeat protein 39B-like n=1 Tax=Sycon ciliatum TaxID=27933 RepID=UPI0020A84220|eukprot:scpid50971/ scgid32702/ Tetratricopeptide repeat protein 39B
MASDGSVDSGLNSTTCTEASTNSIASTDGSDDEEFHDAESSFSPANVKRGERMKTADAVIEMYRAIDLFLDNRFEEAKALAEPWAPVSMYHALALGVLNFLHAFLSAEAEPIERAIVSLRHARKLANTKRRQQNAIKSVSSWFLGKDFASFTDDEKAAELIYTECLLLRGVITFLQDEGLISFARGGLRIRACYKSYKECYDLMSTSGRCDHEFAQGVKYGFGTFNLAMSLLPARVLQLLEFIGYSGDRGLGLKLLNDCAYAESLRAFSARLVLLTFHTIIPYMLGLGDGDIEEATKLITTNLTKYPNGALFLFFKGRLLVIEGSMADAEEWLCRSVACQKQWPQLHHLCYWEIFWSHCFRQNWLKASDFAETLFKESRWSKSSYLYMQAATLLMDADPKSDQYTKASALMKKIPGHKIRIAGRSVPFEKFAIERHDRFLRKGHLFLPAVEMAYMMWSGFTVLARNQELLEKMYTYVSRAASQDVSDDPDDHCLAELLLGVCLRCSGKVDEGLAKLQDMLQYAINSGVENAYLQPYCHVEIGLCFMKLEQYNEARKHFDIARTNFKKYALQSRLHFRMHAALRTFPADT